MNTDRYRNFDYQKHVRYHLYQLVQMFIWSSEIRIFCVLGQICNKKMNFLHQNT